MTRSIGIRELRDSLTGVMRRVRLGEAIDVTRAGVTIATIAPVRSARLDRLVSSGLATAAVRLATPIERLVPVRRNAATEALQDDRGC